MKRILSLIILLIAVGCAGYFKYIAPKQERPAYTMENLPEYSGDAYIVINNDEPSLTMADKVDGYRFSELDELGRTGSAIALIGPETLTNEKRSEIGHIRPAGWHTVKYPEVIDDLYLWNRCHLVGFAMLGSVSNVPQNLFTGTRYCNVNGMLPNEKEILRYIEKTGHHLLYRVTILYTGDNLIADGVLMEAISVEDDSFRLCRYCYNCQPGIEINYKTGDSNLCDVSNTK